VAYVLFKFARVVRRREVTLKSNERVLFEAAVENKEFRGGEDPATIFVRNLKTKKKGREKSESGKFRTVEARERCVAQRVPIYTRAHGEKKRFVVRRKFSGEDAREKRLEG